MYYEKPSLEIVVIEKLDIITTSQITEVDGGGSEGKDLGYLF